MRTILLTATLLIPFLLLSPIATGCKNKDQPRVVLYYSADAHVADPILDAFEKQTGIRVDRVGDSETAKTVGLYQRLLAEKARPACDVFWSNEVAYTIALERQGLLATLDSPEVADWPTQFRGPDGRWHGFALRQRVIAWSPDRVSDADAPRSLEDLLDPKWKGQIVMANPQFGTAGGDVASWFAHYGPDRAREILRQLAANTTLVEGNSAAVREVQLNRFDVCLTDSDDVFAARENGARIEMAPLNQAGRGAMTFPNTVALIRGGPNPAPAKQLAEFLLSLQVEHTLARSEARNQPIRNIMPDDWQTQFGLGTPLDIPYEEIVDNLEQARAEAKTAFGK